jgi:hypothetical protein
MAEPDSERPIPPVAYGHMAFQLFADTVVSKYRYIRSEQVERFLSDTVLQTISSDRKVTISPDMQLWRARLGYETIRDIVGQTNDGRNVVFGSYRPYSSEKEMKPLPSNWDRENRASPRGISYLYLATNPKTAVAEVRPWMGARISVGEFRVVRDLALVDCSKNHAGVLGISQSRMASATYEEGLWSTIDEAFAKPVGPDDEKRDYIPTQILSELFRSHGYDGIKYKSLFDDEGCNIDLFNPDHANLLIPTTLVQVSRVNFEFNEVDTRTDMPSD